MMTRETDPRILRRNKHLRASIGACLISLGRAQLDLQDGIKHPEIGISSLPYLAEKHHTLDSLIKEIGDLTLRVAQFHLDLNIAILREESQ